MSFLKGTVFFNTGYPFGENFKGYEYFDGKFNGYDNIRKKIKGCEIFNSLPFKGYEMITFEWGYEFFKCHFITLNHKAILKVYENLAA